MFTKQWYNLTTRTKKYNLVVRIGWAGWLPPVQQSISPKSLWQFLVDYWQEFVEILKYDPYYIDLERATNHQLAKFFYDTGLFYIEFRDDNDKKLTKNQINYASQLMLHYAPQVLEWLKEGTYVSETY